MRRSAADDAARRLAFATLGPEELAQFVAQEVEADRLRRKRARSARWPFHVVYWIALAAYFVNIRWCL